MNMLGIGRWNLWSMALFAAGGGGGSKSSSGGKSTGNSKSGDSNASSSKNSGSGTGSGSKSSSSTGSTSSKAGSNAGGNNSASSGSRSSSSPASGAAGARSTGGGSSGRSTGSVGSGGKSTSGMNNSGGGGGGNSGGSGTGSGRSTSSSSVGRSTGSVGGKSTSGLNNSGGGGGLRGGALGGGGLGVGGFGTTTAADKTGRLSGAVSAAADAKTGRIGSGLSTGLGIGMSPAQEANVASRMGPTAPGKTSRIGAPGTVSARAAETQSMSALRAGAQPTTARSLENSSMSALRANQSPVTARAAELSSLSAMRAGVAPVSARPAETQSMSALRATASPLTARPAETQSMSALRATAQPLSPRAVEDTSIAKAQARQRALGFVAGQEYQKAVNPATGKVDPYNGLVNGKVAGVPTHADLTNMTISEVQNLQKGMLAKGHLSTAVGKYQTLDTTLDEQVKRLGIDPKVTRFSPAVQDEIAIGLLDNRARIAAKPDGTIPAPRMAQQLANEFASLQQANGLGRYDKPGLNKANVSYRDVLANAKDMVANGAVDGVTARRGAPVTSISTASPNPSRPVSERFASTYLGAAGAVGSAAAAQRGDVNAAGPPAASNFAGETGSFRSTAPSRTATDTPTRVASGLAPSAAGPVGSFRSTQQGVAPTTTEKAGRVAPGVADRMAGFAPETVNAAGAPGSFRSTQQGLAPTVAEKSPRVSTAVTERMLGVASDAAADRLAGYAPSTAGAAGAPGSFRSTQQGVTPTVAAAKSDRFASTYLGAAGATGSFQSTQQGVAPTVSTDKVGRVAPGVNDRIAGFAADPVNAAGTVGSFRAASQGALDAAPSGLTAQASQRDQLSPFAGKIGAPRSLEKPVGITDAQVKAFPGYDGVTRAKVDLSGLRNAQYRKGLPNADVTDLMGIAVAAGAPGYSFTATSGKGKKAKGENHNHPGGFAVDGKLVSPEGKVVSYSEAPDVYNSVARAAAAFGAKGVGVYSRSGHIHADLTPDNVSGATKRGWGQTGKKESLSKEARTAIQEGYAIAGGLTSSREIDSYRVATAQPAKEGRVVSGGRPATGLAPTGVTSDVPTGRPAAAPAANAPKTRSLPDKVLAGAIDVGVGLIPGLGTAASVYGLAAPMLGLPSVGDMALSVRDTNQFSLNDSLRGFTGNERSAESSERVPAGRVAPAAPSAPVEYAAPSERFASTYLAFRDDTPRPTPGQRWGGVGAPGEGNYAPV